MVRDITELLLNPACQFILPLGRDEGVFAGHLQIAVASDLRGFDGATANLLPPRDVRASERVRPEAFEVASLGIRRLMQRIAHAGIPQRLSRRPFLLEHEFVRQRWRRRLQRKRGDQIADAKYPATALALWGGRFPDARRAAQF